MGEEDDEEDYGAILIDEIETTTFILSSQSGTVSFRL